MTHVWGSLNVAAGFYWVQRNNVEGCRGQAGSSSNYLEAPVNPPCIFLVLGEEQGASQTIQPKFLILPGLELGSPSNQSFSWTY